MAAAVDINSENRILLPDLNGTVATCTPLGKENKHRLELTNKLYHLSACKILKRVFGSFISKNGETANFPLTKGQKFSSCHPCREFLFFPFKSVRVNFKNLGQLPTGGRWLQKGEKHV